MLQGQLQSYAASVEDADVREAAARGFGRLVDYVETFRRGPGHGLALLRQGDADNVLAAMHYSIDEDQRDSWAARRPRGRDDARMKARFSFFSRC